MDTATRAAYLEQLGVAAWVLRGSEAVLDDAPAADAEAAERTAAPPSVDPPGDAATVENRQQRKVAPVVPETPEPPPPSARDRAPAPRDWDALAARVADCTACRLCEHRTQTVLGAGARNAPLMLVGEGPGAEEDRQGEPFVGAAGQLLDRMLAAIQRDRSRDVYIANVVKCRPPSNRKPQPEEAAACADYLDAQIELVQPAMIVALGAAAASRLLARDTAVGQLRGETFDYRGTPVMVTYHPAYYLRNPADKAKGWADLKRVRAALTA